MRSESSQYKVSAWLAPGVGLMQRLHMPVKLTTMAFLLGLPLVVVTYFQLTTLFADYATARAELHGAQALDQVGEVLTDVQHLRTQSLLAGSPAVDSARVATLQQLKTDLGHVDDWIQRHPDLHWTQSWGAQKTALQALLSASPEADKSATYEAHTAAIAGLRKVVRLIGEESALVLDPLASSYFLQDILTQRAIG